MSKLTYDEYPGKLPIRIFHTMFTFERRTHRT